MGDKLVTSGVDGIYPAGLAVAKVTKILQNPESPFAKIISTPVAEVSNHLQLLILELPQVKEAALPATTPIAADVSVTAPAKPAVATPPKNKAKPNAPN